MTTSSNSRPLILLTNDDGIGAEGIHTLFDVLKNSADVFVVAPSSQQSGKSLSINVQAPVTCQEVSWQGSMETWAVDGSPADCVKLALTFKMPRRPDLIVSGINHGSNAGRNVLYSGTVGGVTEGILRGIPGVAFSSLVEGAPCADAAKALIPKVVHYLLSHPLSSGTLLNVNFPNFEAHDLLGLRMARQGRSYIMERQEGLDEPRPGTRSYRMGAFLNAFDEPDDSDVHLLGLGYATAVPIHVDELTDREDLDRHRVNFDAFFS